MPSKSVLHHFQERVLQDAMQEATRAYWIRRAEHFEAARPRPGDHPGRRNIEELRDKWREMTAVAKACRARAEMALLEDVPEVHPLLEESA